jgi:hypothetical protein
MKTISQLKNLQLCVKWRWRGRRGVAKSSSKKRRIESADAGNRNGGGSSAASCKRNGGYRAHGGGINVA